ILEFGSVEGLLARLDCLPAGRIKDAIVANQDQLKMSKQLATIITDMPLGIEFSSIPCCQRTPGEAEQLFRTLEFETLLKRLPAADTSNVALPASVNSISLPEPQIIGSQTELAQLLDTLKRQPNVSFWLDIDAHGSTERVAFGGEAFASVVSVEGARVEAQQSLGCDLGGTFSVPVSVFKDIFESEAIPKSTHNVKRAQLALSRCGIELVGCVDDTMLAAFLLQPGRRSYEIDWIALQQFGFEMGEGASAEEKSALNGALVHCLTRHLSQRIGEQELDKVYREIEIPLAPVLGRMQQAGVVVDPDLLDTISRAMTQEIASLEGQIFELAGSEFSIGSPKQLGVILFEKLQLPSLKRTKTGYSTDAETLEGLVGTHEIAAKISQWRELTKLKSTYADTLPNLIDRKTRRVHSSLNQTGAATGRLSSSDPSLQNIPIKTELGRQIRAAFVAAPGCELLSADYSQIELRLLAHFSDDDELIRCFRENEDIHVHTAVGIFQVAAEDVTDEMRRRAKTINFSVIYGKSSFGLAKEFGVSVGEAQAYIEAYFSQYPRVKEFNQEVLDRARLDGYVTTLFGRKRWFPELQTRDHNVRANAERAAFNAPLQGTAADIVKLAMISLDNLLRELPGNMVLQVHDELVFDVDRGCADQIAPIVKREMESVCELKVPLIVDVKCGENWRDMEKCQ
ncbi:MAG: DNA polymerase I, partial [Armatimonadota bacterium]